MDENNQLIKNPLLRGVLIIIASISVIFGIIGAFLPILPTTPFLILSAFIFSKTSHRLHLWLTRLPYFGDAIIDWERDKVIKPKAKVWAIGLIILSLGYCLFFAELFWVVKAFLALLGCTLVTFIGTRKSYATKESVSYEKNNLIMPTSKL